MRILVTGSSGFVGKALVTALRREGHTVAGVSRRAGDDASLQLDLLDVGALRAALDDFRPEVIYHLAARTALKGDTTGFEVNVVTTSNLLEAVAASSSVLRVIWMSSQLVHRPGRMPGSDTDYDPPDAYGASKAEGERLIRAQAGGGKDWVIVRSTTIWGPGMSEHYAGVVRMIAKGLYFHIGRRPLRKSYSYIDNLASQLVALATARRESIQGRTMYLADSDPIELRAWTSAFGEEFNRSIPTMPIPLARLLGKVGDILLKLGLRSPVSSDRVQNVLTEYLYPTGLIEDIHGPTRVGWREGVRRTAAWVRDSGTGPR
jgi:nucleoside-diphosphate-sugar epimerase